MLETPPPSQLSQVISQSIAPAFVLGAVASFISVLVTRLNRIIDRCRLVAGHDQKSGIARSCRRCRHIPPECARRTHQPRYILGSRQRIVHPAPHDRSLHFGVSRTAARARSRVSVSCRAGSLRRIPDLFWQRDSDRDKGPKQFRLTAFRRQAGFLAACSETFLSGIGEGTRLFEVRRVEHICFVASRGRSRLEARFKEIAKVSERLCSSRRGFRER